MASALNVAVLKLQGGEFKDGIMGGVYGNAIYIPIPFIDNSNVAEAYAAVQDKPGYNSVTAEVTLDEAKALFTSARDRPRGYCDHRGSERMSSVEGKRGSVRIELSGGWIRNKKIKR